MAPGLRTDAGGGGEALRCWRSRGAAAGMLLAAGMLSLLARCAVAAEEKSTFDASGFSSLPSDPAATAAPVQVPSVAVQSEGDSDARGLSGQAAFSSVLTVKAGTVSHPSVQDQRKTRDGNHTTTKWPSPNSSHGSEMSSSSREDERIHPTSSGPTPSMPRLQHTTAHHEPFHVFTMDATPSPSSSSSPAPTTPTRLNRVSSSPADGAVTALAKPASIKSELTSFVTSSRGKNHTTEKTPQNKTSAADSPLSKPPATRKTYYFPDFRSDFTTLNKPTETHTPSVNTVQKHDPEINTRQSSNHRHDGASPRLPGSSEAFWIKPPPVHHKSYGNATTLPLNSHIINPTASPAATFTPTGYFVTASSEKPPDTESVFKIKIPNLTPLHSGSVSLERESIRDDLPMTAGHDLAAVHAINKNNKQAVDEIKSVSSQVLENKPDVSTGSITRGQTTLITRGLLDFLSRDATRTSFSGATLENPVRKTTDRNFPSEGVVTHKKADENVSTLHPYFLSLVQNNIFNQDEGSFSSNEYNLLEGTKTSLPHKPKPSDGPGLTAASVNLDSLFGSVSTSHNSHQMTSSGEVFPRNKNSEGNGHSEPLTLQVQTEAESSKSSLVSPGPVTNGRPFSEILTSFPSLSHGQEGNNMSKMKGFRSEESTTTQFHRLRTEAPDEDVSVMDRYRSSSSSRSKIIPTQRMNSVSPAQGPGVSVSSHKSKLYSGTQWARPGSAFSAAPPSPSDGQNSTSETQNPIFRFGTALMAAYTKWEAGNLVSLQRGASESHTTPSSFNQAVSDVAADGSSYQHPGLEDGQEHKMHILSSVAPTVTTADPYVLHSSADGTYLPPSHGTEGFHQDEENTDFFLGNSGVGMATDNTDATSAWTPRTTASATSSKDTVPAYVDKITAARRPRSFTADTEDVSDSVPSGMKPLETPAGLSSDSWTSTVSSPHVHTISSSFSHSSPSSVSPELTSSSEQTVFPDIEPSSTPPSISTSSHSSTLFDPKSETDLSFDLTETSSSDEVNTGTSRAFALTSLKEKEDAPPPSLSTRNHPSTAPTERTSQAPPLAPILDTTPASVEPSTPAGASPTDTENPPTVTSFTTSSVPVLSGGTTKATASTPISTTHLSTPLTRRFPSTTTIRTQTSRRTFTPFVLRTVPPRAATTAFISPFTTTTEATPQQCNITERMWVKTVVSIYVRRNRLDSIQRQNLRRGLSQGLRKALNDSSAQAQVETVFGSPNMTVAYHVTGGDVVYPPSVVLEGLETYGRDKLIADLRQYLPMVTALPLPAALWRSSPATTFHLKTVLQFVGVDDNPRTCRFSQMMERRLERVFLEAQAKVLNSNNKLSVQMLSVSQTTGSPAVSLVYTVSNGTVLLNGTTASNLLGQLSAELVGYFLFYPPLTIAEPLEYHNLNTSVATRDFWVITVIQDVDNTSLEGQYQSFASLMEQRLAELFVLAGQQGTRFRRATTVDSYTVQMVGIRRVSGIKNPAEMTYYVQHNGIPVAGTSAAKVLNTVDSQIMALTLGYFVQLQAEPVVKNPPNNLWIIAAVLAPISVVTLIIIIITAVLCRKNKNDFKADAIGNLNPRAKMAYRRDVGFYHQPVQGFDYAKQHLGRQGGEEETLPASQDTLVMSLKLRDTPLSLEKTLQQDGTAHKKSLSNDKQKSKLPSEDGSVISNESEKPNSGRGLTAPKVTAQQKLTKEEMRKREDPYDTSSGSLQLISIKPVTTQPSYSHHASSDRSQDSIIVNGEVNLALKQKSDIEHYRNKLRLKAKRKGYYDFPSTNGNSSSRVSAQRQRQNHERSAVDQGRSLEPEDELGSTYVKSHKRHSQVGQTAYRSRQSLSSPSPGGTEMDLLVMRERPRKGIRNSGYDTEPELIEETNVDRLVGTRGYLYGRGLKGHSETSTLSSQPSIDEVRQQMHLLLEEAFTLASGGQSTIGRQSHHHQPPPDPYSPAAPSLPYAEVVTSAPGTMSCGQGGLQWVPSYGSDLYQCSLPKPAFRFTQLPEMASPPPLPPRTEPPPGKSVRRSTSDLGPKGRSSEKSVRELQSHHDTNPYGPKSRAVLPSISADQSLSNYSGNPITAVYAIPASRSSYSEYFLSSPPTSYHSPSWMSYPPEPEDVPPQWADSLPLPGYVEAFPHPRYPQGSPTRLPLEYKQSLEQPSLTPSTSSQQNLPQVVKDIDSIPLSSLSTSALVQAIRQEVAKLAKKQNEMFEF